MNIHEKYIKIAKETKPYLIGNPASFESYRLEAFGAKFDSSNLMSCLEVKNAYFMELLRRLDSLTFGHQGMGMEKWVMFDCAAMPAGIVGFGVEKKDLPSSFLEMLQVKEEYLGLVPISMFMALPTSEKGKWFAHNLSSLNSFLGHRFPGLGLFTKAFGCRVFGIERGYGATQWGSAALEIHTQLGNMTLKAARLPVHTHPNSLCYVGDYSERNLIEALSGERRESCRHDFLLDSTDLEMQEKLQSDIERGLQIELCGRPQHKENKIYYPINFVEA